MRHNFISSIAEEQSNSLVVVLKYHILALLQDSFAVLVELDDQTVRSLNRSDFDMIFLDIASSEIVDIRVSQSSEALEEEDIPHTIKRLLRWRDLELSELRQLLPSQEDDLLLRILELRSEGIVGIVTMQLLVETSTQKPLQSA